MRRYLIVDDNQAFAENLAEILSDTGAEVDVASGGQAALDRAAHTRYDALLSDMRMPLMGGAELVRRIRPIDPGLPTIVISAYTNDADLESARHEGLLAVLPKPAPVARLVELCTAARRDGVVLIVEDDVALADNLSEALRSRGFAAVTAASLAETEQLSELRAFVALVDLRVPGGPDGAALAHLARTFPSMPILVITAHASPALAHPHEALFEKPFDTSELLGTIERLHARHRDSP